MRNVAKAVLGLTALGVLIALIGAYRWAAKPVFVETRGWQPPQWHDQNGASAAKTTTRIA